jgi:ferredoxin
MQPVASVVRKLFLSEKSRNELLSTTSSSSLYANHPRRLAENVPGVIYVNNKCINCASCSNFCPESFARSSTDQNHFVYHQPETPLEIENARAALTACPVAAIRLETKSGKRHATAAASGRPDSEVDWTDKDQELVDKMKQRNAISPFPRPFSKNIPGVHWVGHHNDASFGATPYILQARYGGEPIWIMVDVPRHSKSAVEDIRSLCPDGPDFMMLTHLATSRQVGSAIPQHETNFARYGVEEQLATRLRIGKL